MKKMNRITALVVAGVISCTSPMMVMASDSSSVMSQAEEILKDNEIESLASDPDKVGDIIVEDQKGLIFVKEELAEYIADNLTVVRHTNVNTSIGKGVKVDYEPRFEELKGTVSSIRLDSVLALAYPLSRSKITAQIEAGKVFVNGKLITSNGYRLKDNDIISVRKMGRIAYDGILSETKKGRYLISVRKYI